MNNLNITQNSNDLNESEKTQEKLYSNEASLDDILTYSEDISQNPSINKPPTNINIDNKQENNDNNKGDIELLNKNQIPVIRSFNSEVTISFLNNQNDNNINKEYHSKSAYKSQSKEKENKHLIKSSSDFKSISFTKSNIFDIFDFNENNNLKDIKDISEIHNSMSDILSKFEIKDISISRSINNNIKKNNSERKKHNLNNIINNENYLSIRSENLFSKNNKEKFKSNNHISTALNINKEQISEDHSNTNSMCNYQNVSNLNEISSHKNINEENKSEKENSEMKKYSKNELSELSIKLNMSLDNCSKNEKSKFLEEIIDESEIHKKDNYTTSNKKENNFYYSNQNKTFKNSLKYTKAQCINALLQNNLFNNNEKNKNYLNNKQFCPSDNPIITKDTSNDKNNQNLNYKKNLILSPHKLSFEIQKNDSIQININKNKNNAFSINNSKPSITNEQSSLSINKAYDLSTDNNYFYNNEVLKENNTSSFMISPYYNNINVNYQKRNLNNKPVYINNKNLNNQKADSNNFFYNPKNKIFNPLSSVNSKNNNNTIKKSENELQTPDLNKNKVAPMTCVHKGSLVYYNDNSQINNDNTIKLNKINNGSSLSKKNNYSFTKNNPKISNNPNNYKQPKKFTINEKKLVYLKNNINKNNRNNNSNFKKNFIQNKNNSFTKNPNTNYLNMINKNKNKNQNNKKSKLKIEEKDINKIKQLNPINNLNNSKIKKNISIRNSLNGNNNSINSMNNRKNISNKIKTTTHKNNTIIDKINHDLIKESSLFSLLYNNLSQKVVIKNNSRAPSNDKVKEDKEKEKEKEKEKDSTIIHKNEKVEKIKKFGKKEKKSQKKLKNLLELNIKNKVEKKLVKHKTNNSFSIYNSFLEKALNESNKKIKVQIKNNDMKKNKNNKMNDNLNKIKKNDNKKREKIKNNILLNDNKKKDTHKKVNSQINLNALTSNFNFINEERRKNNKSLYNFGNIYFINQNQIIKNDFEGVYSYNNENNNGNYIHFQNKNNDLKLKANNSNQKKKNLYQSKKDSKINENINLNNKINSLNVSNAKQNPKVIMNFSKYKKKSDIRRHISIGGSENQTLNGNNLYNKIEYNETQLISEN